MGNVIIKVIIHTSDSIVIIPTYNEKENIEKIIRAVFGLEKCFHILIIDDGSPDGTAAIVKGLMAEEFSNVCLLWNVAASWDWVLPISRGSSGHWNATISIFLRWMPTSATTPTTCHASTMPVRMRGMTWL